MKGLMTDGYTETGTSAEDLMYFSKIMEKHTEVKCVDAADLTLCHYIGALDKDALFVKLREDGSVGYECLDGRVCITAGKPLRVPAAEFKKEDLRELLLAPSLEPETYATMFLNEGVLDESAAKYYFLSATARKTFTPRLCPGHPESTIMRDLDLRRALYSAIEKPLWFVSRRCGDAARIMAVFGNRPNRIPFTELAEYADDIRDSLVSWRFAQDSGFTVQFVFEDEVAEIRRDFPELEFAPCHVVTVSDTGHFRNFAITGWFSGNHPENAFLLDRFEITDDISSAVDQSIDIVREEAAMLTDDSLFSGNAARAAETVCNRSGITKNSVKCANLIKSYASERTVASRQDFRRLFTDGIRTGAFGNISRYADQKIRTELMNAAMKAAFQ